MEPAHNKRIDANTLFRSFCDVGQLVDKEITSRRTRPPNSANNAIGRYMVYWYTSKSVQSSLVGRGWSRSFATPNKGKSTPLKQVCV